MSEALRTRQRRLARPRVVQIIRLEGIGGINESLGVIDTNDFIE